MTDKPAPLTAEEIEVFRRGLVEMGPAQDGPPKGFARLLATIEARDAEIAELRDDYECQLDGMKEAKDTLRERLLQTEDELRDSEEEIARLKDELSTARAAFDGLEGELTMSHHYDRIGRIMFNAVVILGGIALVLKWLGVVG